MTAAKATKIKIQRLARIYSVILTPYASAGFLSTCISTLASLSCFSRRRSETVAKVRRTNGCLYVSREVICALLITAVASQRSGASNLVSPGISGSSTRNSFGYSGGEGVGR